MMRFWTGTYARAPWLGASAVASAVIHAGIIFAAIVATHDAPQRLKERYAQSVKFMPPPDRLRGRAGVEERLQYTVLQPSTRTGTGERLPAPDVPRGPTTTNRGAGDRAGKGNGKGREWNDDSVATVLEVDTAVQRDPESAAPAYPPALLAKNVEGAVAAMYIVDTTGLADTASLVLVSASDTAFARSVREALPYMRFHPAVIGDRKVRQLVTQTFVFKIVPPAPESTVAKKGGG